MPPYEKDTAILELYATEAGYFLRVRKWDQSPPPVPFRDYDKANPTFAQDHTAEDKATLKTKFQQFVDSIFDTGP
jgi:hypothetical protein